MKLWDKGYTVNNLVDKFTVGNDRLLDLKIAKYDVLGNMAHAKMLNKAGLLSEKELEDILRVLEDLLHEIEEGKFVIEDSFEDVHSKVEFELTKRIGEAGKKIHTARSRNDQVLVDLHLYFKEEIKEIKELTKSLINTLLELAEQYKEVLIPGYTHTQIAMPSSFGLWFSAYAEALIDDIIMLKAAYQVADQNPLGSAAGYGSSFPVDRDFTTKELGFEHLKVNSIAAQMSRGKLEKVFAYALASLGGTLSKMSADVILFMSQNFGFVKFPKELTTGSSIMPHKQNPDVFELIRARSNKIQSLPVEITMITNNLTSGYHRDFQILKEALFDAIDTTKENITVAEFMFRHVQVNDKVLDNDMYDLIFSVEEVNKLVMEGYSFRDAYKKVGTGILEGKFKTDKKANHIHKGSIGNLALDEIREKLRAFDF
jgi:argininosuccinate lyase